MDDCGTSAAKAAPICGSYVVAKGRTRKDDERCAATAKLKEPAGRRRYELQLRKRDAGLKAGSYGRRNGKARCRAEGRGATLKSETAPLRSIGTARRGRG